MTSIVFVDGNDWQGLYVDDVLVDEGHRLQLRDICNHLGIRAEFKWVNQEWLEDQGDLPGKLQDVVWEDEEYVEDSLE